MGDEYDDRPEWVARYGGYPNIPLDRWDVPVADFERGFLHRLIGHFNSTHLERFPFTMKHILRERGSWRIRWV